MNFDTHKKIDSLSEEELKELKRFLFEERMRLAEDKQEQQRVYEKFLHERLVFMEEMKALNSKVLAERKRLKDEDLFFDKKLQILQNGFCQLDLDRKHFEREKKLYRQNPSKKEPLFFDNINFFKGVTNQLGLKKRYKDLLKIFHPDNMCGDVDTVKYINEQYELLKKKIEY